VNAIHPLRNIGVHVAAQGDSETAGMVISGLKSIVENATKAGWREDARIGISALVRIGTAAILANAPDLQNEVINTIKSAEAIMGADTIKLAFANALKYSQKPKKLRDAMVQFIELYKRSVGSSGTN
jgi:hypothetical protein